MRWPTLVACEAVGLALASLVPVAAVPILLLAIAAGGYVSEPSHGSHQERRRLARTVAITHAVGVGIAWFVVVGLPQPIPPTTRVLIAVMLGIGAGLAAGGAALVGADLASHRQPER